MDLVRSVLRGVMVGTPRDGDVGRHNACLVENAMVRPHASCKYEFVPGLLSCLRDELPLQLSESFPHV